MSDWYSVENVDLIPSPSLLVYPDRIQANLQRMIAMAGGVDRLRPHVKTHKMPQVVRMKRELGITKFKTSTIAEAEMTASAGGSDILLAYQPVGPNIERFLALAEAFPETRFSTLVDNLETLEQLDRRAGQWKQSVELWIDLDVGMHRSGLPVGPAVHQLYHAINKTMNLRFRGLHAYDGHLMDVDQQLLRKQVAEAFEPVWKLAQSLGEQSGRPTAIVAGGTPTSAILSEHPYVEVGLGTPVLWDYGQAIICPEQPFESAAVLLTRVVSRIAPNRLCLDLGHKAVASEMPQPRAYLLGLHEAKPVMHSEEHFVVETDRAVEFPPGTPIYAVPHHICPSVALHQAAHVVRAGHVVDTWPIEARNRRLYI
jgi:D-serine deaminase-like pyridoxal phosphate-dependent protein